MRLIDADVLEEKLLEAELKKGEQTKVDKGYGIALRLAQAFVANASKVESRTKGEWKMLSSGFFECTNCQFRVQFPIFRNGAYANYCPNCGADMRGEE